MLGTLSNSPKNKNCSERLGSVLWALSSYYEFLKVGVRYCDPLFGLLTRDTDLSQAAYAYCDGDPVNRVDPTGHYWGYVAGILVAALLAYLLAKAVIKMANGLKGVTNQKMHNASQE